VYPECTQVLVFDSWFLYLIITVFVVMAHPTTGYLDNRCYRELRSYLRHGMTGRNFFDVFLYFLDFKFMATNEKFAYQI
jgi:hypothetical protein